MSLRETLCGLCLLGSLAPWGGCGRHGSEETPEEDVYRPLREAMVRDQLAASGRDISHPGVLRAMSKVPRHELVPPSLRGSAYNDHPLPIGYDQTISQPFIVAFMTQALDPKKEDRVLEIGTGSGYQAAVLAELVREVYTIEIVEPLAARASRDLRRLGYTNILVRHGDGYQGWADAAPFDAIIVTCAPDHVPRPLIEQLREGGRIVIPVGPSSGPQELVLLVKRDGQVRRQSVLPVRFVPMTGQAQDPAGEVPSLE